MVMDTMDQRLNNEEWTMVIQPKKRLFDVDFKGLWNSRDLWRAYVIRNLTTLYKQTILGPLWFFISPIFTTLMYMFVFGGIAGISTDGIPQPLFYLSGITLWSYFSSSFGSSAHVFTRNAGVFGKVYFPRLVVPLASLTSNLVKLLIQLLLFVVVYIIYSFNGFEVQLNATLFLLPFYILLLALHALSWGLIVSSITTKYRDLNHLVSFGMRLIMYATPIIYPMSVAEGKFLWAIKINPLTPIFEAFKYGSLGCGSFSVTGLLYSTLFMMVTLFFSILVFNRVERNFIDTV